MADPNANPVPGAKSKPTPKGKPAEVTPDAE